MMDRGKWRTRFVTESAGTDAALDAKSYDLIVVGGGISGLAAAYFLSQQAGAKARVLVLENHDDFGGHAKRNEFQRRRPAVDRLWRDAIDCRTETVQRRSERAFHCSGH